jgi:membrane-bound serine protease (ClpP class)
MQMLRSWWILGLVAVIASMGGVHAEDAGEGMPDASATIPVTEEAVAEVPTVEAAGAPGEHAKVKVIPVREAIGRPVLYVLRRGLKEAQAEGMRAVVIDMETPGGQLGVTLEIMEALDKFDGETIVYVNKEAISAGAIIASAADEIYFAPGSVIGAAAAVSGGGADIPETMKQKINSYLNAKVRSFSQGKGGFRGEVIRAMMDADYELVIGFDVIKPKGELLSLTDEEAARTYGDPPVPLLSNGTFGTLEELLTAKYGENNYTISRLEVTWSERFASWLASISPLLMGAGLLCVFIEFKTPGFGVFGMLGGLLLALVFFGHHAAGLSGHEPALFFVLGVALVLVELLVVPGTLVAGITGLMLMLGSLVWSMVDVWPDQPLETNFGGDALVGPLLNLLLGLMLATAGALLVWKLLPRGWFFDRLAVAGGMGGPAQLAGVAPAFGGDSSLVGRKGVAATALMPSGQVDIEGRRYEAHSELGPIEAGTRVRVVARRDFNLMVEEDVS